MSEKYNIERGFISKLLEVNDMNIIIDLNIKPNLFTGLNKSVYNFIMKQYREVGSFPTPRVVNTKFPDYELENHIVDGREVIGTDETIEYWSQELKNKARHNMLADLTESMAKNLDDMNSIKAFEDLKKSVITLENDLEEHNSVDITQNTESRKELYLQKKNSSGMIGIETGFKDLDYLTRGIIKGTLTTLIGTTGLGKSWVIIYIACYCMLQGYNVVMGTTEMSTDLMQNRMEAMLFSMMYGSFSYNDFNRGKLSVEKEKQYFDFLDDDLPNLTSLVIEDVTGISSVQSIIDRYKPDIMFIDSAYLMEDEQGAKEDWARATHVSRQLKLLTKRTKLPIFINVQADIHTAKKTGPKIGDIKYTQAWGQDSDTIFALFQDDVMFEDREMGIKILKQREGTSGSTVINWDFSTMNFNSIYAEGVDNIEDGEESEDNNLNIDDVE